MAGGGMEITRFIIEARYTHGFKQINNTLSDVSDVKANLFALLIGIRFK